MQHIPHIGILAKLYKTNLSTIQVWILDLTYLIYFPVSLWLIGQWPSPLHSDLSCAFLNAFIQDRNPFRSFLTVLHLSFGLPLFLFPAAVQLGVVLTFLVLHIPIFPIILIFSSPALVLLQYLRSFLASIF